jgi:class 3 adenylate cyclase/tetratricopeptide (TPR) repeat protein
MKCSACQQDNPPGARFCGECATPLASVCAECGAANPVGNKFCGQCAASLRVAPPPRFSAPSTYTPKHLAEKILTSQGALQGERKTVTVLFADHKGSMERLLDRDPEETRELLDPVLELMMEAVHRYEGTVNQVMGDGIMALFGAPLAHEDHAVRASYAALRMHETVGQYAEELRRVHGADVQIRVGMNSGEVVVRSIGRDLNMDYSAVGHTTHLAGRMQQLARPGTTLVTEATLMSAEGYIEVKALGPTPIRGLAEPIPIFEMVGVRSARTRLHASMARGLTRFVGRHAELDELRRVCDQAGAGRGQLVAVVGEPGVGKSRLFYEFLRSHRTAGWRILEATSVSYGKASPYLPLIDLLRSYFKLSDRDDTRDVRAKVTGVVITLDEGLKNVVPPLLWLLDALPGDHEFIKLDLGRRRALTAEAVRLVLLRESRDQPLLLVFEDLHWIDAETQILLDALVESLPTASALLAVNYRPEYQHSWASKTFYRQLRIDALPRESAEALLEPLLGDHEELRPLQRLLIERTEGNPLFLEESVRSLVETEVLVGQPGAYRLGKDPIAIQVPATVQAILAARIDRLPPGDKELIQTASVIGKDVSWAVLLEASEQSEDELRHGLARLQAAEFLYEARLFPAPEYTFKHALTHEVAYGGVLQERRRAIHARLVPVLERLHADRLSEHVDRLAHHAFRGEVWDKALHYLRQTGATASRANIDSLFGGPESPGYLWVRGEHDRALTVALRDRAVAASFGSFADTVRTNYRLGQIYHSLGDYPSAAEALRRNVDLLEGDLRRETFGLAGLPAVMSGSWLALCLAELGRFDEADPYAQEAAALAQAEDHPFSLVVASVGTAMVDLLRGEYVKAATPLERGLVVGRLSDIPLLFPAVAAPLGLAYALAGRHAEAIALLEEAVERTEAMELAANHALRLVWPGQAHALAGNPDVGRRLGVRGLETARRRGERGHEAYALQLLGEVAARGPSPDFDVAAEYCRAGLTLAETLGMRPLAAALARSLPSPR